MKSILRLFSFLLAMPISKYYNFDWRIEYKKVIFLPAEAKISFVKCMGILNKDAE